MRSVYDLPENRIGPLLAINTVLIVLFQMVLTHSLKRFSQPQVTALGVVLLGLGFSLMPLGAGFIYAAFTVVIWTCGEMLSLPTLTTLVSLRAPEHRQGKYQGLYSLSFSLGLTAGPYLGLRLYSLHGSGVLWWSCGLLALVLTAVLLLLARRLDGNRP